MFLHSQSINPGSEMLVIAKLHDFHWRSTNVDQEAIIGTLRQASSAVVVKILRTLTLFKNTDSDRHRLRLRSHYRQ